MNTVVLDGLFMDLLVNGCSCVLQCCYLHLENFGESHLEEESMKIIKISCSNGRTGDRKWAKERKEPFK